MSQLQIFDSVTRITLDQDETQTLVYEAFDTDGDVVCRARYGDEAFNRFDDDLNHLLQAEQFSQLPESDEPERPTMQVFVRDCPAQLDFDECEICHYSSELCPRCGLCADCCHSGGECGKHPHSPDHLFVPWPNTACREIIKRLGLEDQSNSFGKRQR